MKKNKSSLDNNEEVISPVEENIPLKEETITAATECAAINDKPKNRKSKKEKKPQKPLTKKQNIIIWVTISVLGVSTGGGVGGVIMGLRSGGQRVLEDTTQYLDSSDDRTTNYHCWLYANDSEKYSAYADEYTAHYGTGEKKTDVSNYLSIADILNISFENLDNGGDYAVESKGGLTTTISAVAVEQYLTSNHVHCGNTYFYENDSISNMVAFGMRYIMDTGEDGTGDTVNYHEGEKKNIVKDSNNFVHCTFSSTPTKVMTDSDYAELYGASLKGSCIYLISSKTLSKEEGHEATITSLENGGYELSIRLTKKACQDYITQIINSSGGNVVNVTSFNYSDWVIDLDKDLRPTYRNLKEQYVTKTSYLVSATCTSEINEYFYYEDISLPNFNEHYIQKIEK